MLFLREFWGVFRDCWGSGSGSGGGVRFSLGNAGFVDVVVDFDTGHSMGSISLVSFRMSEGLT